MRRRRSRSPSSPANPTVTTETRARHSGGIQWRLTSRSTRTLLGGVLRRRPSSRRLAWFVRGHRVASATYDAECFLCGADAICRNTDHTNRRLYRCPKCRDYEISMTAMGRLADSDDSKSFASHAAAKVTDPAKIYQIIFNPATGQVDCTVVDRREVIR